MNIKELKKIIQDLADEVIVKMFSESMFIEDIDSKMIGYDYDDEDNVFEIVLYRE